MENKRGGPRRDAYYSQEGSRRRSFNKKPPRGSWKPAVPSWEKAFCKVVGALDWETLVDVKKFVHLYDNVLKWNDSAGEEAFQNAKNRFLAKIQGLPCDIPVPDPDLYIDKVDWDAKVDQELLMELACRHLVPDTTANNEPVVIFGDSLLHNQGFSAPGWGGDFEDDVKITPTGWGVGFEEDMKITPTGWGAGFEEDLKITPTGWGSGFEADLENAPDSNINNHNNPWEQSLCRSRGTAKENGWGDFGNNVSASNVNCGATEWPASWENTWSWNHPDNQKKYRNPRGDDSGPWGTWDVKNAKKNHASRFMSSYRTARFHSDEQTGGCMWRDRISQKKAACF